MSGTLSAFFSGQTPASVTTPTSATSSMPSWYQEFLKATDANAVAAYQQPYISPGTVGAAMSDPSNLVAQMNPDLQQAVDVGSSLGNSGVASTAAGALPGALATTLGGYNPNTTASYMNPYISNVTNTMGTLSAEQMAEQTLPQIQDQMIGAGQFGSSRGAAETDRAVRDSQLALSQAQGQALSAGYGQAQTANLQNLSQLNANETTAMNLGLKQAGAAEAAGQLTQNQNQANINSNLAQFNQQQNYPWTQLGDLTGVMQGTGIPSAGTSGTQTTTTANPSGANSSPFAGLLTSMNAVTSAPTVAAKGGHIKRRGNGGLPKRHAEGGPVHMATGGLGILAPRPYSMLPGGAARPGIRPTPGLTRFPGGLPRVYREGGRALTATRVK